MWEDRNSWLGVWYIFIVYSAPIDLMLGGNLTIAIYALWRQLVTAEMLHCYTLNKVYVFFVYDYENIKWPIE